MKLLPQQIFMLICTVLAQHAYSQSGPGGVGSSSDNVLWLRADDLSQGDGTSVTSWSDASGNSNDFSGASGLEPTYETSEINGLPVVRFGAVDNSRIILNPFPFPTTDVTFFIVQKVNENDATHLSYAVGGSANEYVLDNTDDYRAIINNSVVGNATFNLVDDTWHIVGNQWTNSTGTNNVTFYEDGTLQYSNNASTGSLTTNGALVFGAEQDAVDGGYDAGQDLDGDVAEIILYASFLNTPQRILVENYLSSKYAITIATDVYAYESTHANDLAGIGRSASESHTTAQSAGILQLSSPSALDNDDFLVFAHDAGALAWSMTEVPSGVPNIQRMAREWRLNETGDVGTVSITIDNTVLTALPSDYTDYFIMVDDDGDFSSGATVEQLVSIGGSEYQATGVEVSNGDYVSIAVRSPEVNFTVSSSNDFESTTAVNLEVSLDFAPSVAVDVSYAINGSSTAVDPGDYGFSGSSPITISASTTTQNIPVTVVDDGDPELDETIIVDISSPVNGILGSSTQHVYTINDNDRALDVQFTSTSASGAESTTPVSISVTSSGTDASNITVDYAATGGTASGSGVDYFNTSGTATITPGSTTGSFDIDLNLDVLDEVNETVILTLSNPSSNVNLGTNTTFTFTINDDDGAPMVSFASASSNGSEGTTPALIQVGLSAISGQDVTVDYSATDGTAGAGDYTLTSGTLTIPAGQSFANIQPAIINDLLLEGGEDFSINISNPMQASLGAITAHTFTINDNEQAPVGFSGPGGVGDATTNIVWLESENITGLSDGAALTTWPDNSGNSNDFTPGSGAEPLWEQNELNGQPVVRFGGNDNDRVVRNTMSDFATTAITTFSVFNTSENNGTVFSYASSGSTNDYFQDQLQNGRISIDGSQATPNVAFNDGNWNIDVTTWQSSGGNYAVYKNGASSASGALQNGAAITAGGTLAIGAEQDAIDGGYDAGQDFDGDVAEAVVYNVVLNDAQRVMVENYLSAKYDIIISNDFYAFDGSYGVDVAGIGQQGSDVHSAAQSARIMKVSSASSLDTDGDYLLFGHDNGSIGSWTTDEAPNSGLNIQRLAREWRIDLSGTIGSVSVTLDVTSLPALPAQYTKYYLLVDADGDFTAGATSYVLTDLGGNEFEIGGVNFSDGDFVAFAIVRPEVNFSLSTSEIFESGGPASIEVSLNFITDEDVTIDYAVNGSSTASISTDYVLSAGTLTISAGNSTAAVPITLTDDTTPEVDETLILDISNPSSNAQLGSTAQHTLTIHDTDVANKIQFALTSSGGAESVSPAQFTISMDNAEPTDVTVDYSVTGGTSQGSGIDYFNSSGTATITGGMGLTQTTIDIDINEDVLDEEDETMIVTLTNPSSNVNLGTNTTHTYTITDNDSEPTVSFSSSTGSGNEGSSPANIEVALSGISGKTVTVDYAASDLSATNGSVDYNLVSGTLTIDAGNSIAFITPAITNDAFIEGAESFDITLSAPSGASLGGITVHNYTINDNDNLGSTGPGGVGDRDINILWLEGDAIAGVTSGNAVTTWPDNSGNGNDLTAASGAEPLWQSNEINGQPVVRFGGNDNDRVVRNNMNDFPSTQITTFSVINTVETNGTTFSYASSGSTNDYVQDQMQNGRLFIDGSNVSTGVAFNDGNWNIDTRTWQSSGGNYTVYKNGTSSATGALQNGGSMTAGGTLALGAEQDAIDGGYDAGQDYDGDLAEVIIYNTVLNDAQRIIIENYLSSKFDISVANDFYAFDAQFGYDVSGIGQQGSDQHNAAQSAAIMTIDNASSLDTNGDYLLFGHNNGSIASWTTTEAPNAGNNIERLAREWKLDESGDVGDISVTIDVTSLPAPSANYGQYYLMTDPDGDFSSGAILHPMVNVGGNNYQVGNVSFNDGDFVAIAVARLEIQFNTTSSQTFEPNGPANVQVDLGFESGANVTVDYAVSGTATGGGSDYTLSNGTFTMTAGNTTGNISIPLTNDTELESDETIILTLSNPNGAQLGANTIHTFSINDDDNTRRISFNASSGTNTEATSPVTLTFELSSSVGGDPIDPTNPTTVDYAVTGGTATGGGPDFTLANGTASIAATTTSITTDLVINQDALDEADETIIITLSNPTNSNLAATNTVFTYTIQDDDAEPTVAFLSTVSNGTEGSSPANVEVALSSVAGRDVTVDYTVADVSATNGNIDYNLANGTLTISEGSASAFIQAVIIDDALSEGAETFTITLSSPSGATLGANTVTTFTITDNDSDGFTGPGGVGDRDINIVWLESENISGITSGNAIATWPDNSGNSNDLTAASGAEPIWVENQLNGQPVVRFGGNDNDRVVRNSMNDFPSTAITTITVLNTSETGGTTYSYASSGNTNDYFQDRQQDARFAIDGSTATPNVAFNDGNWNIDVHTWLSAGGSYSVFKNGSNSATGALQSGASITAGGNLAIGAEQDAIDGGYDAGQDYDGDLAEVIIFNTVLNDAQRIIVENYLSSKYDITINTDLYGLEASHDGDLAGVGRASAGNEHIAAQSAGILRISNLDGLDADGEYLLFAHDKGDVSTWTTTEAPNAGTNIQRIAREWAFDETLDVGTATVTLVTNALPALPSNYSGYVLLTDVDGDFSSGAVEHPMTLLSGSEYVVNNLDIADASYMTFATIRRTINFTSAASNDFEPNGPASIGVQLSSAASATTTIDYAVTAGSAAGSGTDYTLTAGTLTFNPGNSLQNIFLTLINDSAVESDETVVITLSNPSAGLTLGTDITHTFTINDDDAGRRVQVTGNASGSEATTPVVITFTLENPGQIDPSNNTTVDYTITGTATGSGTDFTLGNGTATIFSTQQSNTVNLVVEDDALSEADETVIITLSNPTNANLSTTNTQLTYTITDNDVAPTVQFSAGTSSSGEATTPGVIEVALSAASGQDVTVDYTVADVSASGSGVDYTLSNGTLTIPAGNTSGNISPIIVNDVMVEPDETFTVTISSPGGASLGATTVNTFTIIDNDTDGTTGPGGVGAASNLVVWLDAEDITGLADGATLTTWADASGNSNDFTAAVSPTYETNEVNSRPVVRFNTDNDRVVRNTMSDFPSTAITTFAVFNTSETNGTTFSYASSGNTNDYFQDQQQNARFSIDGAQATPNVVFNDGNWNIDIRTWQSSDGAYAVYKNGTATTGIHQIGASMSAGGTLAIGAEQDAIDGGYDAGQDFDGDIGEIGVYNKVLNSAQRILVENYLGAKYSITVANERYTYDATHGYDVAGIGREDASNFHAGATGGMMTISDPASLGNADYLMFGHDNAGLADWTSDTDVPNSSTERVPQVWRFEETGDVGGVLVTVDIATLPALSSGFEAYTLLVDADGTFASGATYVPLAPLSGSLVQTDGTYDFNNGDYVAVASVQFLTNGNGNLNEVGSWLSGTVPGSGQPATISAGDAMTLSANMTLGSLTIESGSSLNLNGFVLTLDAGCITLNGGSFNASGVGSEVCYAAAADQCVTAGAYYDIMLGGTGTKTMQGALIISNGINIDNSNVTLDVTASNYAISVAGNWTNNGTFMERSGTVQFNGSSDQSISAANTETFYNLTMNNSGGNVSLNRSVEVDNTLTLTNGDMVLQTNDLVLGPSGTISGGGLTSYIQADNTGLVNKQFTTTGTYLLPVGDNNDYTPFTFTLNAGTLASPEIFVNLRDLVHPQVSGAAISRYWSMTQNGISGSIDYDVSYTYTDADILLSDEDMFQGVKITSGVSTVGGTVDDANNTITMTGLDSFSDYCARGDGSLLPVEFLYVKASEGERSVLIEWATASETDNDYFTVEKSRDWEHFETVGRVGGAGDSDELRTYKTIDTAPYPGISYYRIKQTDYDGNFAYSDLVSIELTYNTLENASLTVYPNPTILEEGLSIEATGLTPGANVEMKVVSLEGKEAYSHFFFADRFGQASAKWTLPPDAIRGAYVLYLITESGLLYQRILVN